MCLSAAIVLREPQPTRLGQPKTPGRILMTKQGTKPSAGNSDTITQRRAAKSGPPSPVAVRQVSQVAKPANRLATNAAAPVPRHPASPLGAPKRSTPWTVKAAGRVYGYAAVESLVLAFVQASYLIPKDHPPIPTSSAGGRQTALLCLA
jgi:hypothetical protein